MKSSQCPATVSHLILIGEVFFFQLWLRVESLGIWAPHAGDSSYVANGFTCRGHQRLNPLYYIAADQHVANEHTMKYWVKRAKYQCVCQNVWFLKPEWVGINFGPNPVPNMK